MPSLKGAERALKSTPTAADQYSPDFAPSDFYLFPRMKRALAGHHFYFNEDVISAVNDYCSLQDESFYQERIRGLRYRWEKCVNGHGGYVEK